MLSVLVCLLLSGPDYYPQVRAVIREALEIVRSEKILRLASGTPPLPYAAGILARAGYLEDALGIDKRPGAHPAARTLYGDAEGAIRDALRAADAYDRTGFLMQIGKTLWRMGDVRRHRRC